MNADVFGGSSPRRRSSGSTTRFTDRVPAEPLVAPFFVRVAGLRVLFDRFVRRVAMSSPL
ncbi:MAG: hypothetical protein ACR2NO_03155 [Chloroflexota bacterium]